MYNFKSNTKLFDLINTNSFKGIIDLLNSSGININDIESNDDSVYFISNKYKLSLIPKNGTLDETIANLNQELIKFKKYKNKKDNLLFFRIINDDLDEYTENNYNKFISYLPSTSKIILITNNNLSIKVKSDIYNKFIILDNVIVPKQSNEPYINEMFINLFNFFVFIL